MHLKEQINEIIQKSEGKSYNMCVGGGQNRGFRVFLSIQEGTYSRRIVVLGSSTSASGYNTDVVNWTEWLSRILQKQGHCNFVFRN